MPSSPADGFLKSRKGEGTTAEIWLPVAAAAEPDASQPERAAPPADLAAVKTLTVLAVDDDQLVLTNTSAMLEDLGHKVIETASGQEAMELLRRGRKVDLVITDQAMPGMTGVQLADAIKGTWPHIPVILATGYAELPPSTDPALPKLRKPFKQDALAQVILDCVTRVEVSRRVVRFRPK